MITKKELALDFFENGILPALYEIAEVEQQEVRPIIFSLKPAGETQGKPVYAASMSPLESDADVAELLNIFIARGAVVAIHIGEAWGAELDPDEAKAAQASGKRAKELGGGKEAVVVQIFCDDGTNGFCAIKIDTSSGRRTLDRDHKFVFHGEDGIELDGRMVASALSNGHTIN